MLVELTVKNFAVIERARLRLGPGLNVVTGETGAGKSLLVGALATVLGSRADRLDRLLRKDIGNLDASAFQTALADHFGLPNAICRHPDERLPLAKRTMTNAAFVIDLNRRAMLIANGPPCSNAFVEHALDGEQMTRAAE